MKRRYLAVLATVAFCVGVTVPPVYAAESTYQTVAGGSASCTMVKASANPDNKKAGGKTANFQGCDSDNPFVSMPTGYLGVDIRLIRGTWLCGYRPPIYTDHTSSSIVTSVPVQAAYGCPTTGTFHGWAVGERWIASESAYRQGQAISPNANF